jgi:hypothetical protein
MGVIDRIQGTLRKTSTEWSKRRTLGYMRAEERMHKTEAAIMLPPQRKRRDSASDPKVGDWSLYYGYGMGMTALSFTSVCWATRRVYTGATEVTRSCRRCCIVM